MTPRKTNEDPKQKSTSVDASETAIELLILSKESID